MVSPQVAATAGWAGPGGVVAAGSGGPAGREL